MVGENAPTDANRTDAHPNLILWIPSIVVFEYLPIILHIVTFIRVYIYIYNTNNSSSHFCCKSPYVLPLSCSGSLWHFLKHCLYVEKSLPDLLWFAKAFLSHSFIHCLLTLFASDSKIIRLSFSIERVFFFFLGKIISFWTSLFKFSIRDNWRRRMIERETENGRVVWLLHKVNKNGQHHHHHYNIFSHI